MSMFIVKEF